MLLLAVVADAHWNGLQVVTKSRPRHDQRDRIIEALGPLGGYWPTVDEKNLARYYMYLMARLSFPFTAYYPEPTNLREKR